MNTMKSIQRGALLQAALVMCLMTAGAARAQSVPPSYVGKFTLTSTVHWGLATLPPGTYTLSVDSRSLPVMATIHNDQYTITARVMTSAIQDYTSGSNALQLKTKGGQLVVQALVLSDWKTALVYDSSSREQNVEEVRATRSIPVLVAKK